MAPTGRRALVAALAPVALGAGGPSVSAREEPHPTGRGEIVLSEHGYLFVGGRYVGGGGGDVVEGAMYVERFKPRGTTRPHPVVMIHGGGQTGTNFTGTPDVRRGRAHDFLRGPRGLRRRPARPRALGPVRGLRAGQPRRHDPRRAALHGAGGLQALAAGRAPHPLARQISKPSQRAGCRGCKASRFVIVVSDASYHAAYDHCTAKYLEQAGVKAEFVALPERGLRGNGHMMVIERDDHEVADFLIGWLGAQSL